MLVIYKFVSIDTFLAGERINVRVGVCVVESLFDLAFVVRVRVGCFRRIADGCSADHSDWWKSRFGNSSRRRIGGRSVRFNVIVDVFFVLGYVDGSEQIGAKAEQGEKWTCIECYLQTAESIAERVGFAVTKRVTYGANHVRTACIAEQVANENVQCGRYRTTIRIDRVQEYVGDDGPTQTHGAYRYGRYEPEQDLVHRTGYHDQYEQRRNRHQ